MDSCVLSYCGGYLERTSSKNLSESAQTKNLTGIVMISSFKPLNYLVGKMYKELVESRELLSANSLTKFLILLNYPKMMEADTSLLGKQGLNFTEHKRGQ